MPKRSKPRPAAKKRKAKAITAGKRRKAAPQHPDASPLNGVVPPPEHRFASGNQAAVGHGRPRKLADLQELIKETLAEDLRAQTGEQFTRAQAMVRLGLSKNPVPFLEYAFGKVPTPVTVEPSAALLAALDKLGLTLDDIRNDSAALALFSAAGLSVQVGAETVGADSGSEDSGA